VEIFLQKIYYENSLTPIEGVACDDKNGYLYIVEENPAVIHQYLLGDYRTASNGNKELIESFKFPVDSEFSGIEGLTVDNNGDIFAVKELKPPALLKYHSNGDLFFIKTVPGIAYDFSGIAYDEELDLIWVISDSRKSIFLYDLDLNTIIDFWDLPLRNVEGIAICNDVSPSLLYIATDPKASGENYLPLLVGFVKPTPGTGYSNYDPQNPPSYVTNPPECRGCDDIPGFDINKSYSDPTYDSKGNSILNESESLSKSKDSKTGDINFNPISSDSTKLIPNIILFITLIYFL